MLLLVLQFHGASRGQAGHCSLHLPSLLKSHLLQNPFLPGTWAGLTAEKNYLFQPLGKLSHLSKCQSWICDSYHNILHESWHLNTLSKVLLLQMPKGRNCCCFKLSPGSPFVLGLIRKSFSPDCCCLNLHPAPLDQSQNFTISGQKLTLLLTRLSISVKAVVQQLFASWHLWFLLTQSCQTKITASRNLQGTPEFTIYFRFCPSESDSNTFRYHNCNF